MFQVQTVALHSLASACISVSVLVSLITRDAKVPVDRRTPSAFLWFKLLVASAKGDMDKKVLLQKTKNQSHGKE